MSKILFTSELNHYLDFGKKIDEDKLQPIINKVEDLTLRSLLGREFYFTVITNPENFKDLLEGSTFECDGVTYTHDGLKALTAEFVMAKWLMEANLNVNPFGVTTKTEDSASGTAPANWKDIQNKAGFHTESGYSQWEMTKYYLDKNKDLYPKWKTISSASSSDSSTGIKITRIGKR